MGSEAFPPTMMRHEEEAGRLAWKFVNEQLPGIGWSLNAAVFHMEGEFHVLSAGHHTR